MLPRFLLAYGLSFLLAGGSAVVAAPPAPPKAVAKQRPALDGRAVYLGKSHGWTLAGRGSYPFGDNGVNCGMVARELGRQAVLMAAREELGLVTRDAWLDESPLTSTTFDLLASGGPRSLLELLTGDEPVQRLLWKQEIELPPPGQPFDYAKLLTKMEVLSRTTFVDLIRKNLGNDAGNLPAMGRESRESKGKLPAEVEQQLARMNVEAQFAAVRTLHALIRREGTSPARVGGLVRGYANLGLLTEPYWHPLHAVFKARALLYAQRLVQSNAENAHWFRAYAYALAGLHSLALADEKSASQEPAEVQPAWAALIGAHCRYDTRALAAVPRKATEYELARLLRYVCFELSFLPNSIDRLAHEAARELPECRRIADGMLNFRRVQSTEIARVPDEWPEAPQAYAELIGLTNMPPAVEAVLKKLQDEAAGSSLNVERRAKLIAELSESGRPSANGQLPSDLAEFSAPVLGRILLEDALLESLRHEFPAESELGSLRERANVLLAGHAYRPYVLLKLSPPETHRQLLADLRQAIDFSALEPKEFPILRLIVQDFEFYQQCQNAALSHQDEVVAASLLLAGWGRDYDRPCRAVLPISPYSPFARAKMVELHWNEVQGEAASWEPQAAEQPELLLALGKRFALINKLRDAERAIAMAAKFEPGWKTESALADVYRRQGDIDRWIATLEPFVQDPEHGTEVPLMIANYFGLRHQWVRAKPFAVAAAASHSAQGLLLAASVHEALQDWQPSEQFVKAAAESEPYNAYYWFLWCKRTGQGDVREAQRLALAYMRQRESRSGIFADFHGDLLNQSIAGTLYLLDGYPVKARQCFHEEFRRNHGVGVGLHAARIDDLQNDTAGRDLVFDDIRARTPDEERRAHPQLMALAAEFIQDLAQGGQAKFDFEKLEKHYAATRFAERIKFCYLLGAYLNAHGKPDEAIEWWKRAMVEVPMSSFERTLAGDALINRAVLPSAYKAVLNQPIEVKQP